MLSGGSTCRGRDENSNGLCSCGLPRSEALRVASTLAPALLTAATSDCIQEVQTASSTPKTLAKTLISTCLHMVKQGCTHRIVELNLL